jgi:hypothetical protein
MEPRCPKEEDPGSQGQAAKLTDYRGNPNERLRACVHTAAKSSIFLHWPHQGGGATGKPCPDLRRRGPVTPGPGETEECQWEGVPAGLGEAA